MAGSYNLWLVLLSVAVAIMAAYTTLGLAERVIAQHGRWKLWLAGGAVAMGFGIWSMHFIGMLAFRLPITLTYDPLITFSSIIPSTLASAVLLFMIRQRMASTLDTVVMMGCTLGAGIGLMHYIGMAAIQVTPPIVYDAGIVALSVAVAMGLSATGVLVFLRRDAAMFERKPVAAVFLGLAIVAMHYTGMAAASFSPYCVSGSSGISSDWLAIAVALAALVVLGVTVLVTLFDAKLMEQHDRLMAELLKERDLIKRSEERWKFALEGGGDGVWDRNLQSGETFLSRRCGEMLGLGEDDYASVSSAWESAIHPEDAPRLAADLQAYLDGKAGSYSHTYRVRHGDGSWKWIFTRGMLVSRTEDGRPLRMIGTHTDITERKHAEEKLQLAAMVYQHSGEAMMVTDPDGSIITINPAFTKVTGYTLEEVVGKNPRILGSGRHDQAFFRDMWDAINTCGQWQGEVWDRRKNGEIYPKWLTINTIFNQDGMPHRRVALFSDITEKKKSDELIWQQANYDPLTSLPNRRMFHDRLEQEMKKAHRAGLPLALMFLDLDRFKEINDALGHDMGDLLLKEAAQRLNHCVRESDTVARLGGDEFTVILGELEDTDSVQRVAQDILHRLSEPFQLGMESAYVSASIGITLCPEDASGIEELLKNADQAMYAAKRQGRNRFQYFTPAMQDAAQARMRLVSDLRGALARGQFRVYYQPIVHLVSGAIHKGEALIRWQHPVRGLISPLEFIPIAEETGMIIDIGDWIFREAARQAARWRAAYHADFQISVNKSPVQFHDEHATHAAWFAHLRALGLPGQSMVLEITEGVLMDAGSAVTGKLLAFRDAGIQVALDDFGTGYSALSYLKKFDIDYLKIDRSFIRDMGTDPNDLALTEAIVVMAHKLGLKVIAEGVETAEQRNLLTAVGCDYGQGYLFSKPVTGEEFEALLESRTLV